MKRLKTLGFYMDLGWAGLVYKCDAVSEAASARQ